jgi:tetratricopeptide (TPR) repeat protein
MQFYWPKKQYADAIRHGRAILGHRNGSRRAAGFTSIEAKIRRRLADCLEAIGEIEEAESERRRAAQCLDWAPVDPTHRMTEAAILERENRFEEAIVAYEEALALIPEANSPARVECMSRLVLACYHAGRPGDSLDWAEAVIDLKPRPIYLRSAHRMASIALGNLGRLEESEDHCREAYEVAVAEGKPKAIGEILGSLADIQRKRGKLAEAYEASRKAAEVDPEAQRISIAVQAMVLAQWGRFDEALAMLRQHDKLSPFAIPANERKIRAASALDQSRIEAEAGKADEAWAHIQQAIAELGNDPKLGLKCDAVASWIFAARGLVDDSRHVAAQVEERLPDFEADPSTVRGALYDLGLAAWTRGDYQEGAECWDRYLELDPDPVYRPTAHYIRGECRRLKGNRLGAIADYREALELEIDTHHARLARARLAELLFSSGFVLL